MLQKTILDTFFYQKILELTFFELELRQIE